MTKLAAFAMCGFVGAAIATAIVRSGDDSAATKSDDQTACVVKIFLARNATGAQITAVGARLDTDPNVVSFEFLTKAAALKRLRKRYPELVEELTYNPLPDSFEVVPKHEEDGRTLVREFRDAPGVENVRLCPTRLSAPLVWP